LQAIFRQLHLAGQTPPDDQRFVEQGGTVVSISRAMSAAILRGTQTTASYARDWMTGSIRRRAEPAFDDLDAIF
jgi:hypothetical protein